MTNLTNPEFFTVRKSKAYSLNANSKFMRAEGQSMINVVDVDGKERVVNGKVSDSYEIHQPSEIFQSFSRVANSTNLNINNVVMNPNNGGLIISANYEKTQFAGEDHDVNIVFMMTHCGKYKSTLSLQSLRLSCMNQMPILYKGRDLHMYSEKHYKNSLDIDKFEGLLASVPESVNMYNARVENLLDGKMSYAQFIEWFIENEGMKRDAKQFQTTIDKIKEAYYHVDNAGIPEDTCYKAMHCVTWLNTHGGRNTKFAEEQRMTNKAKHSQKIMNALLDYAA